MTDRQSVRALLKGSADDIGLPDNDQDAGRLGVADVVATDRGGSGETVSVSTDEATGGGETTATLNGAVTELDAAGNETSETQTV